MFNLMSVLALSADSLGWIAIGMMSLALAASGVMEGVICTKTVESMARNPEMASKLQTTMILGCALTETTAIYALLIAILALFLG